MNKRQIKFSAEVRSCVVRMVLDHQYEAPVPKSWAGVFFIQRHKKLKTQFSQGKFIKGVCQTFQRMVFGVD